MIAFNRSHVNGCCSSFLHRWRRSDGVILTVDDCYPRPYSLTYRITLHESSRLNLSLADVCIECKRWGPALRRRAADMSSEMSIHGPCHINNCNAEPKRFSWEFPMSIRRFEINVQPDPVRIVNAINARFYNFALNNNLSMTQIGSDSAYLPRPVTVKELMLSATEIADIIIDFSNSLTNESILTNNVAYPYSYGDPVDDLHSKVMKFVINHKVSLHIHEIQISKKLVEYRRPNKKEIAQTRYIAMYEYESATGEPTHLFLNALPFDALVTETPRQGSSELWHIINLTKDNHPLHIHLGLFVVLNERELVNMDEFKGCMEKKNDSSKCHIDKYAKGKLMKAPAHESGWKNVFKMQPGFTTTILVQFSLLDSHDAYPFNTSAKPGYVYRCHGSCSFKVCCN
eukprot:Gb_18402 [translate_table: standard]